MVDGACVVSDTDLHVVLPGNPFQIGAKELIA
jgi:hypothetical protein